MARTQILSDMIDHTAATVASATTCDIGGTTSDRVTISGTTTITGLGTKTNRLRFVVFSGALILTHNATSLILPTGANITTAAGDTAAFSSDGSGNWTCLTYSRKDGSPLVIGPTNISAATLAALKFGPFTAIASATTTDLSTVATIGVSITGTTTITGFGTGASLLRIVKFAAALTLTHNATSLILPGAANITTAAGDTAAFLSDGSGNWTCTSYQVAAGNSSPATVGAIRNLAASATGLSATVSVTADEIVVENSSNAYATLRSVSLSISGATSGSANALDTGTLAASTWYSVWVIWNGATTAGLLSLSATAPTLPSGYTHKARVGWIRTDASGNKYPLAFKQSGRRVQYIVGGGNVTATLIMASGASGSVSTPTWTALAVGAFVPSTATEIAVSLTTTSTNQIMCAPNNAYGQIASTTNPPPLSLYAYGACSVTGRLLLESTNIYYAATAGQVVCLGWEDNL